MNVYIVNKNDTDNRSHPVLIANILQIISKADLHENVDIGENNDPDKGSRLHQNAQALLMPQTKVPEKMLQTKNPTQSADISKNKGHNEMMTNDDIGENNDPNNGPHL